MSVAGNEELSYCRKCGGERFHSRLVEKVIPWSDDKAPIDGSNTWAILQCGGCREVSFLHEHWFSEDCDVDEDGEYTPVIHRNIYPPASKRKMPEWGHDLSASLASDEVWMESLLDEIYEAAAQRSFSLVAMGTRTIIDHIVSSRAGDGGSFKEKLSRLVARDLISETRSEVFFAAFDAGSATSHRGHRYSEPDVFLLLDIAEGLLEQFYVLPYRQELQNKAALDLKARTPGRKRRPVPE